MNNPIEASDPIREFESKANALQRGGMARIEAIEQIKRTSPGLAARYKAAMCAGHPSALTTRPQTDGMITR